MMRAAYITGTPPVGTLAKKVHLDTSIPAPNPKELKPGDILVQVKAFSINVDDIHVAEGSFLGGLPGMQCKSSSEDKPLVVGSDFAGVITAVGSDMKSFEVGDRVCGMNKQQSVFSECGTWAEYTLTQAKNIVKVPEHISYKDAAASVLPLFVIDGLLADAGLKGNERVVVIGASGGIGSMLIQVLRKIHEGIHIVGVCSGRNEQFVKSLGANKVVDYTKGSVEKALKQDGVPYNVVFDMIGGNASYMIAKKVLLRGKRSKYITPTGPVSWIGDEILSVIGQVAFVWKMIWYASILNLIPGKHPRYCMTIPTDVKEETFNLAFQNKVCPHIEKIIAFSDRAGFEEALELVKSHRAKGKVIIEL